jgi:hypothetical protein
MTKAKPETPAPAALQANPAATTRRLAALKAYMDSNVLSPTGFCCASEAACRESLRPRVEMAEGQLSHLGYHFDLTRNGKPLRIVVAGQEYRESVTHMSLRARHEQIHGGSGLACRYYHSPGHAARNPHMRGTTSALRLIFDKGLGADWDGEFVETTEGDRFHVFDGFALANVLLCGAHRPGSAHGAASKVMRRNCLKHFAATLQILEPTLLVLQGEGVQEWIAPVLGLMEEITPHLARAKLAGSDPLVCRFSHPSARAPLAWGNRIDAPYLTEVVEPTIRLAVSLAN